MMSLYFSNPCWVKTSMDPCKTDMIQRRDYVIWWKNWPTISWFLEIAEVVKFSGCEENSSAQLKRLEDCTTQVWIFGFLFWPWSVTQWEGQSKFPHLRNMCKLSTTMRVLETKGNGTHWIPLMSWYSYNSDVFFVHHVLSQIVDHISSVMFLSNTGHLFVHAYSHDAPVAMARNFQSPPM